MFKKITALAILGGLSLIGASFAYTSTDVNNANYLGEKNIIRHWPDTTANYTLDDMVTRVQVISMALNMANISENGTCRGDFPDIDMTKSYADWICRTMESAADHGIINGQTNISRSLRKARPYNRATRAETLGIFMNAFPVNISYNGYSYYLNTNFPVVGLNRGYTTAYNFSASWQASVFYDYTRIILKDDNALKIDPRVNEFARHREANEFAVHILQS